MAAAMSSKRQRAMTDGRDAIGGAARNPRGKRPRQSTPGSSDESSNDDSGDPRSGSESADEDASKEQEEQQMRRVTEQVTRTFEATANRPNMGTESGIIEEVDCTNFMCHGHLTIPLGPLINFITGNNGSGKSAVLTALTICLGGKATATNRAQNLKSLIKEGTEHARVLVRIKNQGPLAYKPMQYGTSITVERHFSRSGTSGFKLRDQAGKIVSTKKSELEDILDAFSMQIDNPMNVLTQDMARQFLNSSTPKDKYNFFLKGTQLENLSRDYQQIEQSLEVMNTRAEVKKADLGILRKQMEELSKKVTKADNTAKMRAAETNVGNQALWAHVEEAEAELATSDAGLTRVAGIISNHNKRVETASEAYDNSHTALEAAQHEVENRIQEMEPAKQEVELMQETWDKLKEKLFVLFADERTMTADYKAKRVAVQKCKVEIEQVRERQAAADDGRYAEKVRQLDEAKTVAERAKEALEAHGREAPSIKEQIEMARDKSLSVTREVEKARRDERDIRDKIQKLRSGQRNWTDSYRAPANLQNLLRAIANERFHDSPVGPLGRYVTLVKPEWGYILDKQFGGSLNAFVVTSRADQVKLNDLMKRCRWEAPILIGNSNPLDTTPAEPDSELLTWMRALRIDNHLVRNQFIINQNIEQIVLMENRQEGVRFMQARPPAKNVKLCFTFADGDKRRGRVLQNTSSGGFNDSPIKEYSGNLRMQADKENQIIAEQAQLEGVQQELKVLERAERDAQDSEQACRARAKEYQKQQRELQVAKQRADGAVDRLEWELSDAIPDAATIEVLEESLTSAEQELKRVTDVLEDLVVAKDVADNNSKAGKKDLEKAQKVLISLESELAEARSTVRKLQHQREDDLKKKNDAISKVAAAEANQKDWELQREAVQQKVQSQTTAAMNLCPVRVAVPTGKTAEWLQNYLKRITATREQVEKEQGGSRQELLAAARIAMDVHETASKEFQDIESLKTHLIHTLNDRRRRWLAFRDAISVRARVMFNYLLSERKFRGQLDIDHKKGLLDINVQPDSTEQSKQGRQTKTLSGGEKSYSTVCLLLALWDAMGSPIRCLDEFDVFMDSVNRERSMKMIIQAARRAVGRQFIFITPQAMDGVGHSQDVRIFKMPDPDRDQTTLTFAREREVRR